MRAVETALIDAVVGAVRALCCRDAYACVVVHLVNLIDFIDSLHGVLIHRIAAVSHIHLLILLKVCRVRSIHNCVVD